jgi:sec-independent protein translocase protein TatC
MVLASPFLLYFIASFVFPALRIKERKYIYRALFIGGGLFLIGVAFCYFVLMPVALAASQMYSQWLGLGAMEWRAEEYISFVCKFMLGMGLGFELPVVILTLVKIGVLNYRMAVPLYMLYEITVWIAWYWEWRDRKRALQAGNSA